MLCSDMLMSKEKFRPAQALIENILEINNTSLLGYEYLFLITDKMKVNNLTYYEKAFALTCNLDPNIGYNLAMNYLRNGQLIESFKVCKGILEIYPKFKKIEKDILLEVK